MKFEKINLSLYLTKYSTSLQRNERVEGRTCVEEGGEIFEGFQFSALDRHVVSLARLTILERIGGIFANRKMQQLERRERERCPALRGF